MRYTEGPPLPELTNWKGGGELQPLSDELLLAGMPVLKTFSFFFFLPMQKIRDKSEFPLSCNIIIGSCAMLGPHCSWPQLTRLSSLNLQ